MATQENTHPANEHAASVAAAIAAADAAADHPADAAEPSLVQEIKNVVLSVREGVNAMRAYEQFERA